MSRSALAGIIGLLAIIGLSSTPAAAGGTCHCYHRPADTYVIYGPRGYDYEPRVVASYADLRMFERRFHPRQQFAAALLQSAAARLWLRLRLARTSRPPAS